MKPRFPLIGIVLAGMLLAACGSAEDIMRPTSQCWIAPMGSSSSSGASLAVATVCMAVDLSPAANRTAMVANIDRITAEHPGVRLILFGETSLGWYYRPAGAKAYQESVAEPVPGATSNLLAAEAQAHGIYISFGLAESAGGNLYNSQVLINPSGTIASVHRKVHLTPWDIEDGFQAGSGVTFDTIDGIRVATVICYDSMSADIGRRIREGGARMVLLPLADLNDETFIHYEPLALMDEVWVVSANRVGTEDGNVYQGHIAIAAPSGAIIRKSAGSAGYLYAEVQP